MTKRKTRAPRKTPARKSRPTGLHGKPLMDKADNLQCPDCAFPDNGHPDVPYVSPVDDSIPSTTTRRSKVRVLKTFKGVVSPYQKLLGVPSLTIKMTDQPNAVPYANASFPRTPPASGSPTATYKSTEIKYPATWWDAVKSRWCPTWVYGCGVAKPTFVVRGVHEKV